MRDTNTGVTVLGHEIIVQEQMKPADAVEWAEDYIAAAVNDLPYASAVWAGIALIFPILKYPTVADIANGEGFTYVNSQMRYFLAMESLLMSESMQPKLMADLTGRLLDLYKLVIDFQVRSVLKHYRSRAKNFTGGLAVYDGLDTLLEHIKKSGDALS